MALVVVQAQEYGNEGVERPYGFPYVAPYVQAPYAGYVPGYYGYGFPYHHNYFPHAPHVPHGAYVYVGHFKGKWAFLLNISAHDIRIPNRESAKYGHYFNTYDDFHITVDKITIASDFNFIL